MKIRIVQFNYGTGGGSATAHVFASEQDAEAFHLAPYLSVLVGFSIKPTPPDLALEDVVVTTFGRGGRKWYLVAQFAWEQRMHGAPDNVWPARSDYQPQLVKMLSDMAAAAEGPH